MTLLNFFFLLIFNDILHEERYSKRIYFLTHWKSKGNKDWGVCIHFIIFFSIRCYYFLFSVKIFSFKDRKKKTQWCILSHSQRKKRRFNAYWILIWCYSIKRMKLSIFQGNFILFSLMIVMMYDLIKWCFLKQSIRLIIQKKDYFFLLSLSR